MAGVQFNTAFICSGTETFSSGDAPSKSVVFEKKMEGVPTVTVMSVGSNQNVIATNVSSAGFDLILSLGGTGDPTATFDVHYQAIFLR